MELVPTRYLTRTARIGRHAYFRWMPSLKEEFDACLFHASAAWTRSLVKMANAHFRAAKLSPTEGFILLAARSTPGINVSDLALVLSLNQSTITKTLGQMELKGLVQREPIDRNKRVFLTGEGEEREADAKAAWMKLRNSYTLPLGPGTVSHLTQELGRAREKLKGEEG